MPKERLHLLIADEAYSMLSGKAAGSVSEDWPETSSRRKPGSRDADSHWIPAFAGMTKGRNTHIPGQTSSLPLGDRKRFFYLLGAISPDTLFYDLPSFGLGRIGGSLHKLLESERPEFFRSWLQEESLPLEMRFWVLGMAAHFMTDALWHPLINRFSDSPTCICREMQLFRGHCHHWLEAELEAFWLARLGPPEGYLPLLKRFWSEAKAEFTGCYKRLLKRVGFSCIPAETRLARCLFWQTFLFRLFTDPFCQALRPRLLARKATRYFGTLIVPPRSSLSRPPNAPAAGRDALETLCDPTFLAGTVSALSNRLSSLGVRI